MVENNSKFWNFYVEDSKIVKFEVSPQKNMAEQQYWCPAPDLSVVPLFGPLGERIEVLSLLDAITSTIRAFYFHGYLNGKTDIDDISNEINHKSVDSVDNIDNIDIIFEDINKIKFYGFTKRNMVIHYTNRPGNVSPIVQKVIPTMILGAGADSHFLGKYLPNHFIDQLIILEDEEDLFTSTVGIGGNYAERLARIIKDKNMDKESINNINKITKVVGAWAVGNKFLPDFHMQLQLIQTEISEIVQDLRDYPIGSQEVKEEMADIFIRLAGLCSSLGINLGQAVYDKHQKNLLRPIKHGHKLL